MGLSRNKVAVSEGAAGPPPFYGERDGFSRIRRSSEEWKRSERGRVLRGRLVVWFSGIVTVEIRDGL